MTLMDARRREQILDQVSGGTFDLVIIGGGINGAGVAHDAARRGLKTLLLEQEDLAFGTSSRSSKLIHGGLRYLETYQFKLVFEGTNERATLRRIAPHLVRPLMFAMPVYEESRQPLWKLDLGLWLYDGLSLFKTERNHVTVRSQKRMLEREPAIRSDGLLGGIIYYDCMTDDSRLTLENAIAAAELGGPVLTRTRVCGVEQPVGRSHLGEVRFVDLESDRTHTVRTKGVVNCTGVWSDRTRELAGLEGAVVRPTKGVHIVVPSTKLEVRHAVALMTRADARVIFVMPWRGLTLIGTTDTDDNADPADLTVDRADVDYLVAEANFAFPDAGLGRDDVIAGWAGLRPLINADSDSASEVPREHQIYRDGFMVTVAGGKLTTYRRMAAEVVDAASEVLDAQTQPSSTETALLPGARGLPRDREKYVQELARASSLDHETVQALVDVYGARTPSVLAHVRERPDWAARICPDRPTIYAEIAHAVDAELGCTLSDVLIRRTSLALCAADQAVGAAEQVADLMAHRCNWTAARRQREIEHYLRAVERTRAFRTP